MTAGTGWARSNRAQPAREPYRPPERRHHVKPIPSDADLMFIETVATGTVHIAVRYSAHDIDRSSQVSEVISGGGAFIAMAVSPTVTRCGKRTFPQFERDHVKNPHFRDEQLCRACYRTLAPEDQERAFEHAQPGDEDDEEWAA